ncbi:beta-glucosidase 4 isoform X1 [Cinnamomum micranthum f. kanehirae]|uniref:Beta-glucosidase n=1 Tax=Cinnamomum micranthum f. kanehirae TaxID=337451 RepID=A0A3S3RA55_9MAGN|nr:beta-glucosidase 4 isoform X1 [Cinnamomum micranthum f. kanehirae]
MANTRNPGEEIPKQVSRRDFPSNFVFGVATSAFQVEGGRKEGGRGDSIWDVFSDTPGNIVDGSNGDVAVDQYHCYKEDVELISKLGFNAYRFSVSWPRIFPDGTGTKINEAGITYYNNLIDALLEKGIQPYLTLYHWDLPSYLHDSMGGWLNKEIVKYFAIYAEACFAHFGDRVKHWITLNEPLQTAVNGYCFGIFAPGRSEHSSTEPYLTAHHQLLAHAAAVAVYKEKFKAKQGGEIGIVVDCEWAEPFSDNAHDKTAAARRIDFQLGWFLDPIYYGDYPTAMRERLGDRLPTFSEKEKELLKKSTDFVGLNHYTSRLIAHVPKRPEENDFYNEQELKRIEKWPGGEVIGDKAASEWLYIVPWGIRKVLNCIAERYHNPPIYVTENGMDEEDSEIPSLPEALEDMKRVGYFKGYLAAVAQSIRDGTDVRGYFAWSFLDNFEWLQGYTKRFGLVYVDYKNGLSRHPKSSAIWFSRFLKGGQGVGGKEK